MVPEFNEKTTAEQGIQFELTANEESSDEATFYEYCS